jgi:signal transduction histidine kinase
LAVWREKFALQDQEKVSIVSDDPEFAAALLRSWQSARSVPEFEIVSTATPGESPLSCVAVLDGAKAFLLRAEAGSLVIAVGNGEPIPELVPRERRIVHLRRSDEWAEFAAALSLECVLHKRAMRQVSELEKQLCSPERFSAMGRFIAAQQHELANALTSVLGHSELLMTQPDLQDDVRRKVETIHAMSMRIYEVLQQLASLNREMQRTERLARLENPAAKATSQ